MKKLILTLGFILFFCQLSFSSSLDSPTTVEQKDKFSAKSALGQLNNE